MSKLVVYREYEERDYPYIIDIIKRAWGYEDFAMPKTADLLAAQELVACLGESTYTQVALVDGKPVGFIIGSVAEYSDEHKAEEEVKEIKRKIKLRPDGLIMNAFTEKLVSINETLYKEANEDYDAELSFFALDEDMRGLGIGGKLFKGFEEHLRKMNAHKFYVYTDSYCNIGFYEHENMKLKGHKQVSMPIVKSKKVDFYIYEKQI